MGKVDMSLTKQIDTDHQVLPIWSDVIPGNCMELKSTVMEGKKRHMGKLSTILLTLRWLKSLVNTQYVDSKRIIDSYVMNLVAREDKDYHETFTDVPYLIPYIAKGSKKAVIVVPGGGYCFKSMESEGTQIAEKLQANGITAFVLWYRSCPYYMPIPLLDMQRAVRVVRSNAEKYGYSKDEISAVGFSAGGAQISLFANIFQGREVTLDGYKRDSIDDVDDRLNYLALVYPALNYDYNYPMMFASFPANEVRNETTRLKLKEEYDAIKHFRCAEFPHYFCYGTKDTMVSLEAFEQYRKLAINPNNKLTVVEGAGHGYGASVDGTYAYWLDEYIEWMKER